MTKEEIDEINAKCPDNQGIFVQPQHQSFADSIDGLAITDRPKPEDYD